MHPSDIRWTIRELVEPTIQRMGFDLVAVEWGGGRRRPTLRLSVDAPGGIGADDCAAVSRRVSLLLDEADPISAAYVLEVSSPGMERPMQRLSDFRRFVGYTVRLRLVEGLPRRRFTGELKAVHGEVLSIEVDGEVHEIDFEDVEHGQLVLTLEEYDALKEGLPADPGPASSSTSSQEQE